MGGSHPRSGLEPPWQHLSQHTCMSWQFGVRWSPVQAPLMLPPSSHLPLPAQEPLGEGRPPRLQSHARLTPREGGRAAEFPLPL